MLGLGFLGLVAVPRPEDQLGSCILSRKWGGVALDHRGRRGLEFRVGKVPIILTILNRDYNRGYFYPD